MKSFILRLFAFLLLSVAMAGCTKNNGDIGYYFGEWALESLSVDGVKVTLYGEDAADPSPEFGSPILYTLAFQGEVARITVIYQHHDIAGIFGSWQDLGDKIVLNFSHHDDLNDEIGYKAPDVFGFPSDRIVVMTVKSIGKGRLHLEQSPESGEVYEYYFVKRD